jgi:hypothetical protein
MQNIDKHVEMVCIIRKRLFPNNAPTAEHMMTALAVYESALKAEGVGEIKETLGQLAPLFTAFVEGLTEAANSKKP